MELDPRIEEMRERVRRWLRELPESSAGAGDDADPVDALDAELMQLEAELGRRGRGRLAEEAIGRQSVLPTVLESMVEGVIVADLEGRFLVFNQAAQNILGRGPTDAGPEGWSDEYGLFREDGKTLFPSDELPLSRALQGESVNGEVLVVRTPNSPENRYISANARPLFDEQGEQIAAVVAFHDITQTKLVEHKLEEARRSAEESARAKTHFLANMSHEIRTPLTAVIGFADLLLDPRLSASDRLDYVQTIRRNGQHLLALINDVLDLSKIEAERMRVERVPTSLPDLLHEVTSMMQVRAHDKGLSFELDYETPIPEKIDSDPVRLRQILLNLVGNAIKFTREGGVRIAARCCDVGAPAARLEVDVIDTGIGLDQDEIDGLFQAFHQANISTTRQFGGTGLGLAICRPLAEALGGEVGVRSTPGEGSTFTLILHQAIDEQAAMAMTPRSAAEASPESDAEVLPTLSGRVLLAEDGHDNQILLSTILRGQGLKVVIAENGEDAVSQAMEALQKGEPFDIVLMDMQMPRLDGYGATSKLRSRGYSGPVVALTAHAMTGERERCLAAGCDDYLSKPVSRPVLIATIQAHLRRIQGGGPGWADSAAAAQQESSLYSRYAADPDMAEIIPGFVERLPLQVRDIRDAADKGDTDTVGRLAHQLKGAAGGYGFMPVSEAAARCEKLARDQASADALSEAAERLAAVCNRVRHGAGE